MREKLSHGLLQGSLAPAFFIAVVLAIAVVALAAPGSATEERRGRTPAQQGGDPAALMTRAKLGVDLGDYQAAADAFSTIAGDESAPHALRWEALVRLGLARLAAGDSQGGADAFQQVTADYSDDPDAIRFLLSAAAGAGQGKIWLGLKPQFEELLRLADIVKVEELVMGVVGPKRVYLTEGEIELSAIFRPASPRRSPADNALYEVAAYEIDKLLSLDMVPPVVERGLSISDPGSLQLWVEGIIPYQGLEGPPADWAHQSSRIATFDNLIGNRDRNLGNILIAPGWGAVLIDHRDCFASDAEIQSPPDQFDRHLVEKLRTLDREVLQGRLDGVLSNEQIDSIIGRRDALLDHLERLIVERGEERVLF